MDEYDDLPTSTPSRVSVKLPPPPLHVLPSSDDCWSEDATHTLVDAWDPRRAGPGRGSLRREDRRDVASAVNPVHKARSNGAQCKNRIDTLKKKHKIAKAKLRDSPWPFFARLNSLIGRAAVEPSPPPVIPHRRIPPALPFPPSPIPVGPRSKRQAPAGLYFRRDFSAVATEAGEALGGLAEAIQRFGDIYERVERAKQRQMVEIEKQRMHFAKDLECHRMKLFVESQVQLEKIRCANLASQAKADSTGSLDSEVLTQQLMHNPQVERYNPSLDNFYLMHNLQKGTLT
ncbi:hypothetical protein RJ640_013125 [Escallonia rubra]|uniref:Myb/SANT-like DNA-binding domain-containing protein n=1 Tax=Escallonia rubra TaxID=112253 RepID=A0AA88RTQ6_9ASTE|nr:hypothetical protein RJ640_013125 [Escallonia rubra]